MLDLGSPQSSLFDPLGIPQIPTMGWISPPSEPPFVPQATFSTTEMALALNRYLCLAVMPLITKCAPLFAGTEHRAIMVDSMLHTIYRLSRGRALTKAQRDAIEECLMALCRCDPKSGLHLSPKPTQTPWSALMANQTAMANPTPCVTSPRPGVTPSRFSGLSAGEPQTPRPP